MGPFDAYQDPFGPMAPSMFAPQVPNYQGIFNFPTNSPGMMMVQQLLGGPIANFMARNNTLPSQFFPLQSLLDQARTKQYYDGRQQALAQAAMTDAGTYESTIMGAIQAFGGQPTAQNRQYARQMAKDISGFAPMFAQMQPVLFDRLHGRRGSATMLADSIYRSGQLGIDPATGRYGMSGASAASMSQEVFQRLYGAGANIADMRGMGAGQAGALYEQLMQRGMVGPAIGGMQGIDQLRALAGTTFDQAALQRMATRTGLSVSALQTSQDQIRKMAAAGSPVSAADLEKIPGMQEMLTTFDSHKTSNRLKELSGVVSAMRDIFGDAGHPNAPMRQLIDGLEKLTQNGMSVMSPQAMERQVRQVHALSKQAGVDMQTVLGLSAQGASIADRLGISRQFVLPAVTSSIAFGAAAGQSGNMQIPAWGAMDRDKLMLYDQQLRLNAAASPLGNRLAAVMRLRDEGLIKGGTAADAMAAAIAAGESTFTFGGKTHDLTMSDDAFRNLLGGSGLTAGQIGAAIYSRQANQEYGVKYNVGDIARTAQAKLDSKQVWNSAFADASRTALVESGIATEANATALSRDVGAAIASDLQNMSSDVYRDTAKRNAALEASAETAIRGALKRQGKSDAQIDSMIAKLGPSGLRGIAIGGWGQADEIFSDAYWGGTKAMGRMQLDDKYIRAQAAARQAAAASDAIIRTEQAGLGQDNPIRRITDAIIDARSDQSTGELFAKIMGGQDLDEVAKKDPIVQSYLTQFELFRNAERKDGQLTAAGAEQQRIAARNMEAMRSGGAAAKDALQAMAREFGVQDPANLERAIRDKYRNDPDAMQKMLNTFTGLDQAARGNDLTDYLKRHGINTGQLVSRQQIEGATTTAQQADVARALINDDVLLEQMGAGGLEAAQKVISANSAAQEIAAKYGASVQDILAGKVQGVDASDMAAIQRFVTNAQDTWEEIKTSAASKSNAPRSALEIAQAAEARETRQRLTTQQDEAAYIVDQLVSQLPQSARAGITDDDRKRLQEQIISGNKGEDLVTDINNYNAAIKVAKQQGLINEQSSTAEIEEAVNKITNGGSYSVADAAGSNDISEIESFIQAALGNADRKMPATSDQAANKGPMQIKGTLTIKGDVGTMDADIVDAGMGSTPVGGTA